MRLSKTIWVSAVISVICTPALAQQAEQILTGTVAKVDGQKGTITIQTQSGTVGASGSGAEEFKTIDPLLFNALQPGDKVTFAVSEANGTKTITRLNKP
jgi:Cu/Ag efflux protein CusF